MTNSTPGTFDFGVASTDVASSPTALVPPRRLGRILSAARAEAGLTLEDVAAMSQGRFSLSALSSIERGTWELSDDDALRLSEMYRVESTALVPPRSRLIVDLDEGYLQVDAYRATLQHAAPSTDEVLARYLTMVYSMRRIEPGRAVTLRVEDLDVLGRALHVGTRVLAADLEALMSRPAEIVGWRNRILNRRVLIPAAGVLVAALGVGALVLVQSSDPVSAETTTVQDADRSETVTSSVAPVPVDIGTAIVQERNADGSPGEVRIRTGAETTDGASVQLGDATSQWADEIVTDNGATLIAPETLER